jgi:hypothetical protein
MRSAEASLVPTFRIEGCRVGSAAWRGGSNLGFLDWRNKLNNLHKLQFFFFQFYILIRSFHVPMGLNIPQLED